MSGKGEKTYQVSADRGSIVSSTRAVSLTKEIMKGRPLIAAAGRDEQGLSDQVQPHIRMKGTRTRARRTKNFTILIVYFPSKAMEEAGGKSCTNNGSLTRARSPLYKATESKSALKENMGLTMYA